MEKYKIRKLKKSTKCLSLKQKETAIQTVHSETVKAKNSVFQWKWYKRPKDKYQRKIFSIVVSKIRTDDNELKLFDIPISEVLRNHNRPIQNIEYSAIKKAALALQFNGLVIADDNKKTFYATSFFNYCEYENGHLFLQLNDELKGYFLGLKKLFTQFSLNEFLSLPTDYSMDLFGLLSSFKNLGSQTFGIDEIRKRLDVRKKAMNDYAEFKMRILEPAIKAINKLTSLKVSYREFSNGIEGVIKGRKVTHLLFEIQEQLKLPGILSDE